MTCAACRWLAAACLPAAIAGCTLPVAPLSRPSDKTVAPAVPLRPARPITAATKPGTVTLIQLDRFFPLQQTSSALIYDVRPGISYRLGHIPGALSWPKSQFDAQLASREPEMRSATTAKRPVILYCSDLSCPDSIKVATRLTALGHSLAILEGGYAAWKTAELPTE